MDEQGGHALQMVAHGLPVVFARALVEQMASGEMALPAGKRQQAAQRTHMSRGEAEARMRAAEHAVDDVQRIVVTADDKESAFYLFAGADEFGLHRLAGVEAFAVAGHADDGVGAGKAGHSACAARERDGVAGVAHHAEAHAYAFFHAGARGQGVAGHDIHDFLRLQASRLPLGEERKDEFFHSHDGRDRVARRADDGDHAFPGADDAQGRGLAGHDGHAVHVEIAQGTDDRSRVVVRTGGRACVHHDEVGPVFGGGEHGGADGVRIIGDDGAGLGDAARVLDEGGEDERVEFGEHAAGAEIFFLRFVERDDLRAAGDDGHLGAAEHCGMQNACGGEGAEFIRAYLDARGEDDLGGHHVFAELANVLPREGGLLRDHRAALVLDVEVFHFDDGVGSCGERMPGVYPEGVFSYFKAERAAGRGGEGVFGLHGYAVHSRAVEGWRGAQGFHRAGEHAAQGLLERYRFFAGSGFGAELGNAREPEFAGLVRGFHREIGIACHGSSFFVVD